MYLAITKILNELAAAQMAYEAATPAVERRRRGRRPKRSLMPPIRGDATNWGAIQLTFRNFGRNLGQVQGQLQYKGITSFDVSQNLKHDRGQIL